MQLSARCDHDAEWCVVELATSSGDLKSNSCTKYYKLTPNDESTWSLPGGLREEPGQHDVYLRLSFVRPQRAVTPGQAVVLYGPVLAGCDLDKQLRSQGSDLEHASRSPAKVGASDVIGMNDTDHDDDTVICAATIAFPGQSLYEQGAPTTTLAE